MKNVKKWIASFVISICLIECFIPNMNSSITAEAAVSKKQTVKFVSGVDGDTAKFKVKGKTYTYRFLAVDTPETVKPGMKPAYMGKKASDYTKKTLKNAKKIQIQYDGSKTDKYGRKLAWIWVDGKLLQNSLVKKGYARVYYIYGDYKYTDTLRSSEKQAKKKKLGVWKNYNAAFPDGSANTSASSNSSTNKNSSYVWISRTGTKYHADQNCSGMKSATKLKKSDAEQKGYEACKKCF